MARSLVRAIRGKQRPERDPTEVELAYLAGVMDSDGCFSIAKMAAWKQRNANPRYVFCMNVINTSEDLMKWLVERFGGRYSNRRRQMRENHKITFDWYFTNGKALWLLEIIRPYLVVKTKQCDVALDLLKNWKTARGGAGIHRLLDPQEVGRRESCYQEMKRLNRLGLVQPQRLNPLAPQAGDAIV